MLHLDLTAVITWNCEFEINIKKYSKQTFWQPVFEKVNEQVESCGLKMSLIVFYDQTNFLSDCNIFVLIIIIPKKY